MDLAASRICSSKLRLSSASCETHRTHALIVMCAVGECVLKVHFLHAYEHGTMVCYFSADDDNDDDDSSHSS